MNTTFWLMIFAATLMLECVLMNMVGISFAPGALAAVIMSFCGLPMWSEVLVFIVITVCFIIFIRPVLAIYFNKQKKQARFNKLIGRDAIVICEIDNAHGVGVVNIGGVEYKARSKRPNARIPEGTRVVVVEMRMDTAIVDDFVRGSKRRMK